MGDIASLLLTPCSHSFCLLTPFKSTVTRTRQSLVNNPVRHLNLHEYQSKDLMNKFNVRVQRGKVADTAEQAQQIAEDLLKTGAKELVIKAQIHAGGRGKGTFINGFKGGVKISKR